MYIQRKIAEANRVCIASTKLWHERLGHVNTDALKSMVRCETVTGVLLSEQNEFFCENCPLGKQFKLPFKKNEKDASVAAGDIIHNMYRYGENTC